MSFTRMVASSPMLPLAAGVLAISSASGSGIEDLKEYLWKLVDDSKADTAEVGEPWEDEGV